MLGLTVACARCHDHKFDPIPTKDYYSLYGVFASCNEPAEKPLLGDTALPAAYNEYVAERKKREQELEDFRTQKQNEARDKVREQMGDYLLAAYEFKKSDGDKQDSLARERKLDAGVIRRWSKFLENHGKENNSILGPWLAYSAIKGTNFSDEARQVQLTANGTNEAVNPVLARVLQTNGVTSLKDVAVAYNIAARKVVEDWNAIVKTNKSATALADADEEMLRKLLYGTDAPTHIEEFRRVFDIPTSQKLRALQRKIDELDATHPGTPPRAMALVDNSTPTKPHVFKRGNPNNPGEEVPRQFLKLVAGRKAAALQKRERPSGTGAGHCGARQSVNGTCFCQSRLDVSFRRTACSDPKRFRGPIRPPHKSGTVGLSGRALHGRWLVHQEAAPAIDALEHLPAKQPLQSEGRKA